MTSLVVMEGLVGNIAELASQSCSALGTAHVAPGYHLPLISASLATSNASRQHHCTVLASTVDSIMYYRICITMIA